MAETKKYYWLKLHKDFFKRHDIRIVESMDNGKDYILFYMKLLLESVDHDGYLRFSDTIPYNEKTLSIITDTNIDIVRSAIKVFRELNLMEILDDETIFMTQTQLMLGVETEWAKKKRIYRSKQKQLVDIDRTKKDNVRQEIEKEKELDIEIDKDKKKEKKNKGNNSGTNVPDTKETVVYFSNPKLNETFEEFIKHRKSIKAKMTDLAITKMVNKIKELNDDDYAIELLNESIVNGWKGIFPKQKKKSKDRYDVLNGGNW